MVSTGIKIPKILTISFNQDYVIYGLPLFVIPIVRATSVLELLVDFGFTIVIPSNLFRNMRRMIMEDFLKYAEEGIGLISILYKTQILALVGSSSNKKCKDDTVVIFDNYQNSKIGELFFKSQVTGIQIMKEKLIVAIESGIYIFDLLNDFKVLRHLKTMPNPTGILSLSGDNDKLVLATLGTEKGLVHLENYYLDNSRIINAFQSCIQSITVNHQGTLLAVTDTGGIIIKVYSAIKGDCVHIFRRGIQSAIISNACFDLDNLHLAISTNKKTIHIFELTENYSLETSYSDVLSKNITQGMNAIKDYLPEYLNYTKSKSQLHLADTMDVDWSSPKGNIVGPKVIFSPQKFRILIVCPCGNVFKARFNPLNGGESQIEKKMRWLNFQFEENDLQKSDPNFRSNKANPQIKMGQAIIQNQNSNNNPFLIEEHFGTDSFQKWNQSQTMTNESQQLHSQKQKNKKKNSNSSDDVDMDEWYIVN